MKEQWKAKLRDNRGVTMVEMMVGVVVFLIVSAMILSIFLFASNNYRVKQVQSEQNLVAILVEDVVTDQLRFSRNVTVAQTFTGAAAYDDFQCIDGTLYWNGEALAGGDRNFGQQVEVVFVPQGSYAIDIKIRVYQENSDIETNHEVSCKLVNMELKGETVVYDVTFDGSRVYFIPSSI